LKAQFGLGNQAWITRNQLLALRHTGKIQAYIKEFTGLMLEIKDMSEEDILFHFMNGLQPWAQSELRCQNVQTLATTITTTEKLLDFRGEPKTGPRNSEDAQGEKQQKGRGRRRTKERQRHPREVRIMPSKQMHTKEKKLISCWICAKEHYAKNCPLKQS
jgi:hypothetical protein